MGCLGSVSGAIAFAARVAQLSQRFPRQRIELIANKTDYEFKEVSEYRAVELRFSALHFIFAPFELGFVILSQLLILYRMQQFSVNGMLRMPCWTSFGRLFLAAVVSGIILGICGNIVSAKHFIEAADLSRQSVAVFAAGDNDNAKAMQLRAKSIESNGAEISGIQRFCEVCILVLVISVYVVVGAASYRIISSALRKLFRAESKIISMTGVEQGRELVAHAASQARRLQFKILATLVFVFVTVLVRSVFSVMYALSLSFNQISNKCSTSECDPCKNVYSHILSWILYTPEFQQATMLIASPVSQLVALWGMSGVAFFEQMAAVGPMRLTQTGFTAERHNDFEQMESTIERSTESGMLVGSRPRETE